MKCCLLLSFLLKMQAPAAKMLLRPDSYLLLWVIYSFTNEWWSQNLHKSMACPLSCLYFYGLPIVNNLNKQIGGPRVHSWLPKNEKTRNTFTANSYPKLNFQRSVQCSVSNDFLQWFDMRQILTTGENAGLYFVMFAG